MSLQETFVMSIKNIWSSKTRTFLTMLGIIIGVTAVIVIVGLGNGMENYMTDSFASLGTNTLTVQIMGRGSSRSVSEADIYAIASEYPELLDTVSPTVSMQGVVKVGTEELDSTSVTGVSEEYFSMSGYEVSQGRGLQYVDIHERKAVCVVGSMINVVITILAVIAGISLLVGGIGIMNIMLVSVTERTREIGIRKALGAKEGSILRQFVMEAATTSGLGGILGILLGYVLSSAATAMISMLMDTALVVTPSMGSVLLAFGISTAIGITFGYLPARKAARLNPIDALRYD